jgi:hypothetical protein
VEEKASGRIWTLNESSKYLGFSAQPVHVLPKVN